MGTLPLTPQDKMRLGAELLFDHLAFFASVVASWGKLIVDPGIPTAATNGPTMRYNPAFVADLTIADSHDLTLHEAGHVILGHHVRMGGRDPELWNIAGDLSIYDRLAPYYRGTFIKEHSLKPGSGDYAHLPAGKSTEWYYDALLAQQQPQPQPQGGQGGEQPPQAGQGTPGTPETGSGDADPQPGADSQGGQPGATRQPFSLGEVEPVPDEGDPDGAERDWERQVARAVLDAKTAGDLPGWATELVEELYGEPSEENWRLYMRRFLTQTVPVRLSYDRPNRRMVWRNDFIFPANRSKEAAPGCFVVDTSGSMNVAAMNAALREAESLLTLFSRCEVTLRMADVELYDTERVYHRYDFPLTVPVEWEGRGGTNLAPAIAEIAESRRFKWIVVVSDMRWDVAGVLDPGVPVLWVTTENVKDLGPRSTPSFGQVIGPVREAR